ncbi:MAG: PRC-barrel domain-containing protein [Hyphomonas sp.]
MKPLLITASAVALMMSAAACTEASSHAETVPPAAETAAATPDQTQDQQASDLQDMTRAEIQPVKHEAFTMAPDEILASNLIGSDVLNPVGDVIATVADVWIGEAGDTPKLILRDGGVAGVGGTLHAIGFDGAIIEPVADSEEPDVRVTYSQASLEGLPVFEQDGLDDFRLASEAMGTTAALTSGDNLARVNDFIMKTDGTPEYVVLSDGLAGMTKYVVDADALTIEQGDGDGTLVIDLDADALAHAKVLPDQP